MASFIRKPACGVVEKYSLSSAVRTEKSTLMSALGGLYMMVGDGEGGSEVQCVATKRDQARIVFTEAVNMVTQSPALSKYIFANVKRTCTSR